MNGNNAVLGAKKFAPVKTNKIFSRNAEFMQGWRGRAVGKVALLRPPGR
jgi:hypothetical protein